MNTLADAALSAATRLWALAAITGQLIFVYYIAVFYGTSAIRGDFPAWNKILSDGYVSGHAIRNLALSSHLLFAATITFCGVLQLIPVIRTRLPRVHRWIGRIYIPIAFTMGISGIYLITSGRKIGADVTQSVALSINALLIIACAALAWRYAVLRDFAAHRRWALRLFLFVSGAWFLRVGLMLLVFLDRVPAGFDPKTFQGPVLSYLAFAQFLVPLGVLELYLRTEDRAGTTGRLAMATALVLLTIAMSIGIFSATMHMWLPHV